MTMLENGIWQTVSMWRRRASPDKPAQPEAHNPDKPGDPSPDEPETASPDKSTQPKSRLRRFFGNKLIVTVTVTFCLAVVTVFGTNTASVIWDSIRGIGAPGGASPSRSQPPSGFAALPFNVDATEDFEDCNAFALPAALGQGRSYAQLINSAPATDTAWGSFLSSVSGAPVSGVGIALTFTSNGGSPVVITDIEIKQVKPPGSDYSGAFIPLPHQGGGDNSFNFKANLDRPNATLEGEPGQKDFLKFGIIVSPTVIPAIVDVQFTGTKHAYSWVFVIDYDEDGPPKTLQVDAPGGGPFTLTGPSAAYGQVFAGGGQGYVLTTQSGPSGQ
jgi:hypothetical protein